MRFYQNHEGFSFIPLSQSSPKRLSQILAAMCVWMDFEPADQLLALSVKYLLQDQVVPAALITNGPFTPEEESASQMLSYLDREDGPARDFLTLLSPQELNMIRRVRRLSRRDLEQNASVSKLPVSSGKLMAVTIYLDILGCQVRLDREAIMKNRKADHSGLLPFVARRNDSGGIFHVVGYRDHAYLLDRFLCEELVAEDEILLLPERRNGDEPEGSSEPKKGTGE